MSEEVKEILDDLKYVSNEIKAHIQDGNIKAKEIPSSLGKELRLNNYSAKILLDYITNLQEEKQRLLESADCLSKGYNDLEKRIDKTVEVIDLITPELWNISNKMTYRLKDVKNILRGDE